MGSRRHCTHLPRRRRRSLRSHRRPDIHPGTPVERLVHQRHRVRAPATEDKRADRHPVRILPSRIDRRALRGRRRKSRVRMRRLPPSFLRDRGRPTLPLPVRQLSRWFISQPFPPHAAFRSQRDIREDAVLRQSRNRVRIGFGRCPRRNAKKSGLRLIACNTPFWFGFTQAISSPTVHTFQPS